MNQYLTQNHLLLYAATFSVLTAGAVFAWINTRPKYAATRFFTKDTLVIYMVGNLFVTAPYILNGVFHGFLANHPIVSIALQVIGVGWYILPLQWNIRNAGFMMGIAATVFQLLVFATIYVAGAIFFFFKAVFALCTSLGGAAGNSKSSSTSDPDRYHSTAAEDLLQRAKEVELGQR